MVNKGKKKQLMNDRWYLFSRWVQLIWIVSIAFVAYVSLSPQIVLPVDFKGADKVYHFLAYLWLAVIPFFGFQNLKIALAGALCMLPFGIGLEYAQGFMLGRFFSMADMAANGIGVFLGLSLGRYIKAKYFAV